MLVKKYRETDSTNIIAFHHREDVSHSGVAEFDNNGRILRFIEKPKPGTTNSHWVNAGIYLLNNDILKLIPNTFSDFAKDIFPILLNKKISLYSVKDKADFLAFDTPEMYKKSIKHIRKNNE